MAPDAGSEDARCATSDMRWHHGSVTFDLLHALTPLALVAAEEGPKPEDVKAGWTGFAVLIFLIVAVVLLLVSMTRHMRKIRRLQAEDEELARTQSGAAAEATAPERD